MYQDREMFFIVSAQIQGIGFKMKQQGLSPALSFEGVYIHIRCTAGM